jgi:hypothetical protein
MGVIEDLRADTVGRRNDSTPSILNRLGVDDPVIQHILHYSSGNRVELLHQECIARCHRSN